MTFFLNAVREAEIPISGRLLTGTKPRSGPTKRRLPTAPQKRGKKIPAGNRADEDDDNNPANNKSDMVLIIEMFNPEIMNDDEQEAVWTLIRYLKKRELLS